MIAAFYGNDTDISTLRRQFDVSMQGTTLKTLINLAGNLGLTPRPVRCELNELSAIQTPAVLHWSGNHFVVLERAGKRGCMIHDPALGSRHLNWGEMSAKFTGVALELTPNPRFQAQRVRNPLKLSSLLRLTPDVLKALAQSLLLSIVIEALLLASPFYIQLSIDDVITKGDSNFMAVLASVFAGILLFRVSSITVRALTLQFVSQLISFEMQARVFHHMLRLPLQWFNKRHVGDIQSRFGAIQPIKAFIANGAIAGLIDGILATLVFVLMLLYSVTLATIVFASLLIYLITRIGSIQLQRRLAGDLIVTQALEQSRFLESVRAIETIKSVGGEVLREGRQRNAMAASINSGIRSGNVQIAYSAFTLLMEGMTDIVVVYFGAIIVLKNFMTLGMLTAFLAYKQQFYTRTVNLVEQLISWRLLSVDLERISDIALSPMEAGLGSSGHSDNIVGAISCNKICFSYGTGDVPVLESVSFNVAAGDYIVITGQSGCGKSTLIKLITGLYRPSSGEVLLDGRNLENWDPRSVRQQISIVMQSDNLLAGSISENIGLFDEQIDMDLVRSCASLAQIASAIEMMPMGYDTLVGDLGSSLSGGQKQRVLLARALYRKPKILILDEGTSHLDVATEEAINAALAALKITRVVVAHRPETIKAAPRRIHMAAGRIVADERALPV